MFQVKFTLKDTVYEEDEVNVNGKVNEAAEATDEDSDSTHGQVTFTL